MSTTKLLLCQCLAKALRSNPYQVNLLLGGVEDDGTPSLYFMDYLASMCKEKYAAHGYGSFFILSTMDKYYKVVLTFDDTTPPHTAANFQVLNMFFLGLNTMTPFTADFQYRRFFASPESSGIWGVDYNSIILIYQHKIYVKLCLYVA